MNKPRFNASPSEALIVTAAVTPCVAVLLILAGVALILLWPFLPIVAAGMQTQARRGLPPDDERR